MVDADAVDPDPDNVWRSVCLAQPSTAAPNTVAADEKRAKKKEKKRKKKEKKKEKKRLKKERELRKKREHEEYYGQDHSHLAFLSNKYDEDVYTDDDD